MNTTEFLKTPLSEAIIMVLEDMENMVKKGIDINMSTWLSFEEKVKTVDNNYTVCAVCVGGAAIMPFISTGNRVKANIDPKDVDMIYPDDILCEENLTNITRISKTFDSLRLGHTVESLTRWYDKPEYKIHFSNAEEKLNNPPYFGKHGIGFDWKWEDFKRYMISLSSELKEAGY